jgi:putative FmdB family regulatory protein
MPTYEYRCPSGHEFERFYRKISDAAPGVTCPECGRVAERFMSVGGGFAFKGSGFYLTDYGKNAHRGSAPNADGASGDGAGGTEPSSAKDSSSSEPSASSKESAAPVKETLASKDGGSSVKGGSGGDAKPATASKPAESKSSSESKPKKSSGSKSSKEK